MIYLDNNSTTRIDPLVFEAMLPYLTDQYGNAASDHSFGLSISEKVKQARYQVTNLIGCDINELIFTSGATESINLAIKGVAESYISKGRHIVTVKSEHNAVLDVCRYLEKNGFQITYLPVNEDGLLDLDIVEKSIRSDTILVSVMFVNNETGVMQPIKEIAEMAHKKGAIFMCDATQAVGKYQINVKSLDIDMMAFSGHKFYGPKGIGGLYIRQRRPSKIKIESQLHGGGHERGFRSGTLNVPGIIGLGKAAEISMKNMLTESIRIKELRDKLEVSLLSIPNTKINGCLNNRLYNTSNILFSGCDSDALIVGLNDIIVSNGSACTSKHKDPSHVLLAMHLSKEDANCSLRISIGRFNTENDIELIVEKIKDEVHKLRSY